MKATAFYCPLLPPHSSTPAKIRHSIWSSVLFHCRPRLQIWTQWAPYHHSGLFTLFLYHSVCLFPYFNCWCPWPNVPVSVSFLSSQPPTGRGRWPSSLPESVSASLLVKRTPFFFHWRLSLRASSEWGESRSKVKVAFPSPLKPAGYKYICAELNRVSVELVWQFGGLKASNNSY